jgi:hypothetical protein
MEIVENIMNPWFETSCVIALVFLGIICGRAVWQLPKSLRTCAYFLPLLVIIGLIILRLVNLQTFIEPLFWISTGRFKFVILSLAVTMGLTAPLPQLPYKWEKIVTCIIMAAFIMIFFIPPFLAPALVKNDLAKLNNKIDSDGNCFQSKNYTCAPAAAVTALRKLGFPAHEGEIAILARTNPFTGTLPGSLYTALQKRYEHQGLNCSYRRFDSITQLQEAGVTLVAVKDAFLRDHCVAVLEVSDDTVTIADPSIGKTLISRDHFARIWRFSGIVMSREILQSI